MFSLTHKDLTFILLILIGMTLPAICSYWIFSDSKITSDNIIQFLVLISISIPIFYKIGSIAMEMYYSPSLES